MLLYGRSVTIMAFWLVDEDNELLKCSRGRIGGKGLGLVRLKKCGLNVPSFGIIDTDGVRRRMWNSDVDFQNSILKWCKEILTKHPNGKLAVRSSACEEDQRHFSFAGKFLTEVVSNLDEVIPTLDKIAEHYEKTIRELEKKTFVGGGMAIIIQEFISGEISGVCFSAEPLNAQLQQAYCEVVIGENKTLVDGVIQPTRVYFHLVTAECIEIETGSDGPKNLPENLLSELSAGLMKMEWEYYSAVDIEWTWDGEKVCFLQVRPITVLKPSQELYPQECATCWFFDQRFIRPITPITRTTLIPLILQKAISDALDMRGKKIGIEPYYFGGQVYIPHRIYFDLLEGCPDWWLSSDLKLLFDGSCECPPRKSKLLGIAFWVDAFHSLLKNWRDAIFVLTRWKRWKEQLEKKLQQWNEGILSTLSAEELIRRWEQYQNLTSEFLEIHRWAILWSSYVYRLGGKYIVRGKERLFPSITTKANHILTTYLSTHNNEFKTILQTDYAHRTETLDFISPRWGEWLTGEAENEFFDVQIVEEKQTPPPKITENQKGAGFIYEFFAKFIQLREEQRFEWEKVLYEQKKILREIGRRLKENGLIVEEYYLWFLTWEELVKALRENIPTNKNELHIRIHQWCLEHTFPKPTFISRKIVHYEETKGGDTWFGWGIAGERVKGIAYVTDNPTSIPTNIQRPRILVTQSLNPGQTWCLQYWDGVLLERGSELSHPAIIAREMNIPMIANLPKITRKIQTGDLIYMDASSGKVVRLPGIE